MPAASDADSGAGPAAPERPQLPHTWRPLGPLVLSIGFVVSLAVVSGAAWMGFDAETQAKFTVFQISTLFFLFLLVCVGFHALGRSRVTATAEKLIIVNGWRRREYAWPQVLGVSMPRGAPWAVFDLADGESVVGVGIQGSDGARARRAVRQLRLLIHELGEDDAER
ncbi:PH domain-containing protein [Nocardioides insulae]|uniref:PH domain-containing protein n=1 Tax=Nocardioides insulae TaxID=394734 RepID=UPI00041AA266|nr:PH domain-containing protein [Nocardioides insulae]